MDVLIIEDEAIIAKELEANLFEIDEKINVLAKLSSVKEGIEWLKKNTCNVIFADIELSDGLSFSIFTELVIDIPIVFTTAYNKYAIKAFELNSVGYLLKPIETDALEKVLEKYEKYVIQKNQWSFILDQLKYTKTEKTYRSRLMLSIGNTLKPVSVDEIAFFMADDRYLFAFTNDGKRYFYDSTLSKLEEDLDPNLFFRVNRRFFVHKCSISEIINISKSRLSLKFNIEPPEVVVVSYSKNTEFKNWISE